MAKRRMRSKKMFVTVLHEDRVRMAAAGLNEREVEVLSVLWAALREAHHVMGGQRAFDALAQRLPAEYAKRWATNFLARGVGVPLGLAA